MNEFTAVLLLIGVTVFALRLLRPPPTIVVEVKDGRAVARKGRVPLNLLQDLDAILSMHDISDGWIKVYPSPTKVTLKFSSSIPPELHQRFRNVWHSNRDS